MWGYGQFKWKNRTVRAHRFAAYLWLKMDLDDPRMVCHKCDNPRCFNPKHLFIGTGSDNQLDAVRKGRHNQTKKTHCPQGHPYDQVNTFMKKGRNGLERTCRACVNKRKRAYYRKNKSLKENN